MEHHDQLGFLPKEVDFSFSCGEVRPMPSHALVEETWKFQAHPDGYVYPPYGATYKIRDEGETWEKVPNSDRPLLLHRIPWSHDLYLHGKGKDREQLRRGITGFVIHFFGFLYGYRVQFFNWWADGRILTKSQSPYRVLPESLAPACINQALKMWESWDLPQQTIATNALYMFSRNDLYEFGWERFLAEYMVLDSVYRIAEDTKAIKKVNGHEDRLKEMARTFNVQDPSSISGNRDWFKFFTNLRNNMVHQVCWDGSKMPGSPGRSEAEQAPRFLHEFTRRILLSLFGIKGPYLCTPWWTFGTDKFDVVV